MRSTPESSGHAFGIEIRSELPLPGIERAGDPPLEAPETTLQRVAAEELEDGFSESEGAERLREWQFDDGAPQGSLDHRPELGYRLSVRGYGTYVVSPDGLRVRCALPARGPRSRWQGCLCGQILPLAAVLRGVEGFHASVVRLDDAAIGLAGPSMAGKTSVALNLVLCGARFVADDVLAVREMAAGELMAHPGPGVTSVRHAEAEAIGDALSRLGPTLDDDGEALRVLVAREHGPLPLGALYFLDRGGPDGTAGVEVLPVSDPRLLLGSSFSLAVSSPERLRRRLELCACIAGAVPQFRVRVGAGTTAAHVAERVERHAAEIAVGALR